MERVSQALGDGVHADVRQPSAFGEVWYAEADSPYGPWGPAVKVLSHENYTFYNPRLHPEFTPADSPILLFEGTYTQTFANRPEPTPRYDYNQILYRLDLDDPKLAPAQEDTESLKRSSCFTQMRSADETLDERRTVRCIVNVGVCCSQRWRRARGYVCSRESGRLRPADVKIAIALGDAGRCRRSFKWSMRRRGKMAFEGESRLLDEHGASSTTMRELDFSALNKTGKYFVRVRRCEVAAFEIDSAALRRVARSAAGVHAAAAVWIQPVGRCGVPLVRWPHRGWAAAGRKLCRCPRRLARCGRSVEVSAHVEQRDGADAAGVSAGRPRKQRLAIA